MEHLLDLAHFQLREAQPRHTRTPGRPHVPGVTDRYQIQMRWKVPFSYLFWANSGGRSETQLQCHLQRGLPDHLPTSAWTKCPPQSSGCPHVSSEPHQATTLLCSQVSEQFRVRPCPSSSPPVPCAEPATEQQPRKPPASEQTPCGVSLSL